MKTVCRKCIFLWGTIAVFVAVYLGVRELGTELAEPKMLPRVAHAGGGYKGATYTNSREAIDASLERGFEWIEIDFIWTRDGELVCIHDWKGNFTRLFGYEVERPLSLEEFKNERSKVSYSLLALEDLAELMRERPSLVIVSDVKDNNLAALELMRTTLPEAKRRVVPQIYQPAEFESVRKIGYENIIWTLYMYRWQKDIDKILEELESMDVIAVCMPIARAEEGIASSLAEAGVSTYAHTVNQQDRWLDLKQQWSVTQVYTDFLPATD